MNRSTALREIFQHLQLSYRLLMDKRVSVWLKAAPLVVAAAYVLWPVDVVPDLIPGLGQVDDVAMIVLALKLFEFLAPKHVVLEHLAYLRGEPIAGDAPAGDVVDGEYRIL